MGPLQSLLDQVAGWAAGVAVLLAPGAVATVLWSPFLASKRIRALFADLPPRDSILPSYVPVGLGASLPFVLGLLVAIVVGDPGASGPGDRLGETVVTLAVVLTVAYVAGVPVLGAFVLPRVGLDWDSTGYGPVTWLLLAVGGLWYALVFAVPLLVLGVVYSLPGGY